MQGFFRGFLSYIEAAKLISEFRLWRYALAPALISLLLGGSIFVLAWQVSDDFSAWLLGLYPFDWGRAALDAVLQLFGGLIVVTLGLLIFKHLVLAITSPFMSFLSEVVEHKILGRKRSVPFSLKKAMSDLARGLSLAFRNIFRELFYTVLLLLLGLLLPILSPAIPFAIFAVQAFYAGFGNLDFTLERYYGKRDSVQFARQNRGLCLGNGSAFLLLLFTIFGFLAALPLGTVAATREALRLLPEQETEPLVMV